MPAPVRHRGYRDVQMLLRSANDAALGLLVGDRIARRTLEPLEAEHASTPLSGLYSEDDIPDVGRFDFRVPRAVAKLQEAELELCVMAVPFAVSLYNEYLVSAAELLELAHVSRPPTS